jgi:hypothetical protein
MSILRQAQDEGFNGKMRDNLWNDTPFFGLDHTGTVIVHGWRIATRRGHIHRGAIRRQRHTTKNSPQRGKQTPQTLKVAG